MSYEVLIEVRRATDLVAKKLIESPATYVKVYVDDQFEKTDSIKDLDSPVWNSSFVFNVDQIPQRILFEVRDDRTLLPDAKLGNHNVDLTKISGQIIESRITLINGEIPLADAKHGSLDVSVSIQPKGYSPSQKSSTNKLSNVNNNDNLANNNNNNDVISSSYDNLSNRNKNKNELSSYDQNYMDKANQYLNTDKNTRQNMARQYFDRKNNNNLIVTVVDATGFKKADFFSKSDSYIEIQLGNHKEKTKTASNKQHAEWNETFVFPITNDELSSSNLEIRLMDNDVLIDDKMGKGTISKERLLSFSGQEEEINVPLYFNGEQNGMVHLKIKQGNDNMKMSNNTNNINTNNMNRSSNMNYSGPEDWTVTIIDAQGVKKGDLFSKTDPYVVMQFGGIKEKTKVSSRDKQGHPIWNESFVFPIQADRFSDLEVKLMDDDILKDDEMGSAFITKKELLDISNIERDFNVPLRYKGEDAGFLRVKVKRSGNGNMLSSNNINFGGSNVNSNQIELNVTVVDAQGTKETDLFTKSDPYVIIKFDGHTEKTKVAKDHKTKGHPIWNESFVFPIRSNQISSDMQIQLMDDDMLKDDQMGTSFISKSELINMLASRKESFDIPLTYKGKDAGFLHMKIGCGNGGAANANNMNIMSNNINSMNNLGNTYAYNNNNNNNISGFGNANSRQLNVTIIDGEGTKETDLFTKADPYVVIKFGDYTEKTKVSKNHKAKGHPMWNESFVFPIKSNHISSDMQILLMDDDMLKDDQMGQGIISRNELANMLSSPEREFNVPLTYKGKDAGFLHVKVGGATGGSMSNMGNTNMGNMNMGNTNMGNTNMGNMNMNSMGRLEELNVTVIDAEGDIKETDLLTKSDPYVIIKFDNHIEKTKVAKRPSKNDYPTWNQSFVFPLRSNQISSDMEIQLMDDDMLKDDQMGRGVISRNELMNLSSMQERDFNVPLTYKNKNAGILRLRIRGSGRGSIMNPDINGRGYQQVDKSQFEAEPSILYNQPRIVDDRRDEAMYESMNNKQEYHVLPPIHVQERPTIVEKEITYEKPIEVHSTIIHREMPVIIEKPIIKEKHEHYRDATEYISRNQQIVTEKIDASYDMPNTNEKLILENLRKERLSQFQDVSPIVQNQKEHIQLDTIVQQQPSRVFEKQVVYEQPIEIEQKHIEHIRPKVQENITIEKQHVLEKMPAQIIQQDVEKRHEGDFYFSNDQSLSNASMRSRNASMNDMNNNIMHGNQQGLYGQASEMEIIVVDARGIKKGDFMSKADPYIVIKAAGQTYKTKTVSNSDHPIWNETLNVPITNDNIEVLLMDDDLLKDDEMGRGVININQISNIPFNQQQELDIPLTFSSNKKNSKNNHNIVVRLKIKTIGHHTGRPASLSMPSAAYGHQQISGSYNNNNNNNIQINNNNDVYITVVNATTLKKQDWFSKSDPYVIINCGNKTRKTKTANGSNPQWNETLHFHSHGKDEIQIQVKDSDVFKDDPMGQGVVSLSQLSSYGQEQDINVPLTQKGENFGTLHLRIRIGGDKNYQHHVNK